jgi:hypothetical protein
MTTETTPTPAALWAEAGRDWTTAWTAFLGQPGRRDDAPPDAFLLWRRGFDRWLAGWSAYFEQTLTTPEAARASGRLLDAALNVEKPLREQTATTMQYWLEFFNLPSRQDQVRSARQLNDVSARLDELQVQFEDVTDQLLDRETSTARARAAANGGGAR